MKRNTNIYWKRLFLMAGAVIALSAICGKTGGAASAASADTSLELKIAGAEPVLYLDGRDRISVQGGNIQSVRYLSSNRQVAEVRATGEVLPKKKGYAKIEARVTYLSGQSQKTAVLSYSLKVMGKSTEYFVYATNSKWDVRSHICGLTEKGRGLKDVYIPGYHDGAKVQYVDSGTFGGDRRLERVFTADNLLELDYDGGEHESPNPVFQDCVNLREISLGRNVQSAGCIRGASSLEKISVDPANKYYRVRDRVLYDKEGSLLVCYPAGRRDREFVIPAGVSSVGEYAFSGAKNLQQVSIPSHMRYLRDKAFYGSGLTEVTVPAGVESYHGAFAGCASLERAEIQTTAGAYGAFRGCSRLRQVLLPRFLGGHNFSGCKSLERVTFTRNVPGVKSRGDVLFSQDGKKLLLYPAGKKAVSYTLPAGTEEIEEGAFEGSVYLSRLVLDAKMRKIGDWAFYGAKIKKIVMNAGLRQIGTEAFMESCLESAKIPDSVKKLGSDLFSGCKKLRAVRLPAEIRTLPVSIFYGCSSLKKIHIPGKVKTIRTGMTGLAPYCGKLAAFTVDKGNRYFKTVGGVLYNKSGTTLYAYPAGRKGKRYVLPETVKRIKSGAFAGSRRLQEIKMNRRAVSVGAEAFSGGSLKKVTLSPRLKRISERAFFGCKKLTEISLPNSVEKIEESAFQECGSLRRVTIGRRVKRIRRFVFSDCASLRSLVFRGKRMTFGYPDAWVQGNVVFQRAGSRNYKGLRVKLPKSKKGERKKWKKLLWQYGLDRRAKIVFAK